MTTPDITDRLRRWSISTDAVPASDLMDEAAAEIERLRGYRDEAESQASIAALAAEGRRLTDAERHVLRQVRDIYADEDDVACNEIAAVIDGLLERLK